MAADYASPDDLELLRQSQTRKVFNPNKSNGSAASTGHLVKAVSPTLGDAILRGTAHVNNAFDSADMAAGEALHRAGVPASWLTSEESINLGRKTPSGLSLSKNVNVKRLSKPIGRLAGAAAIGSLGLLAYKKLVGSHPDSTDERTELTHTAAIMPLTNLEQSGTVDSSKLAAFVIDKQATLISELQTAHTKMATYAAALAQAVKLAQDGLIDVVDINDHAHQLIASGSVKLSAADAVFDQSPGELQGQPQGPEGGTREQVKELDSLTRYLRNA